MMREGGRHFDRSADPLLSSHSEEEEEEEEEAYNNKLV